MNDDTKELFDDFCKDVILHVNNTESCKLRIADIKTSGEMCLYSQPFSMDLEECVDFYHSYFAWTDSCPDHSVDLTKWID